MSSVASVVHNKQMAMLKYWAVLLYLVVGILVAAVFVYQKAHLSHAALGQLTQVNQLKYNQLTHWMDERIQDAYLLGEMHMVQQLAQRQVVNDAMATTLERLELIAKRRGYAQILLLDNQGQLVAQTNHLSQLNPEQTKQLWRSLLASASPRFTDQIENDQGVPYMDVVAPIREEGQLVGGLVLRVDPAHFIEPLIAFWPSNVTTALSFFSRLRHNQIVTLTPINIEGTAYQAGKALSGYDDLVRLRQSGAAQSALETTDFLGRRVWLACHYVAPLERCLVSQIQQDELMGSVYQFSLLMLLIGWLVVTLLVWGIWRVYRMAQMEQHITHQTQMNSLMAERKAYYEGLFFNAPLPYMSLDNKSVIQSVNQAWLDLFALPNEAAAVDRPIAQFLDERSLAVVQTHFSVLLAEHHIEDLEFCISRADGVLREVSAQGRVSLNAEGEVERTHCILTDITEKRLVEQALKQAASVFNYTIEGIMVTDAQKRIVSVNPAFTHILGYEPEEAIGQTPRFLQSGKQDRAFYEQMWAQIEHKGSWSGEVWNRCKNGKLIAERLSITTIYDERGNLSHYVGIFADITRLKEAEFELTLLANQDPLTGLPNRRDLRRRLADSLELAKREGYVLAVIMVDIDKFKAINDSYGHSIGDELLKRIAEILLIQRRKTDIVARISGDEFMIVLNDIQQAQNAARVVEQVFARLEQPHKLSNGIEIRLSASAGVSVYPDLGNSVDLLLQQADIALYHAKTKGRKDFFYFSEDMRFKAQERLVLEQKLKQALKLDQFHVYYQPEVDVQSGQIIGAEALVRWLHPERGMLAPSAFIEISEETGLVVSISEWVLRETCRQGKAWLKAGHPPIRLGVNIADAQWQQPDWVDKVKMILGETSFPAECLELEITERSFIRGEEVVLANMKELSRIGVHIAIDDFGSGHSSLSYLKRLPLDVLKIDKCFIDDLVQNEDDRQLVEGMIAMAHSLKLRVMCEGVETQAQLDFLKSTACESYQGYLKSPPLPAEQFERLLAAD